MRQILAALTPVIQDRTAVEKDHVGVRARVADAFARQRDAVVEAQDVERAVEPHRRFGFFVGKFFYADYDAPQMLLQAARYRGQRVLRQFLDFGERWRQSV